MCPGDAWGWSIHPQGTGIVLAALASLVRGNKCFAWRVCGNPVRFVLFPLSISQKPLSSMCSQPLLPPRRSSCSSLPGSSRHLFPSVCLVWSCSITQCPGCWLENWPQGWSGSGWSPVSVPVPQGSVPGAGRGWRRSLGWEATAGHALLPMSCSSSDLRVFPANLL